MCRAFIFLVLFSAFAFGPAQSATAQSTDGAQVLALERQQKASDCEEMIESMRREIGDWRFEANFEACLVFAVFAFGAAIVEIERRQARLEAPAEQASSSRVRITNSQAVMVLGVTTSLITAAIPVFFPMDFRQLYTEAKNAESIQSELEHDLKDVIPFVWKEDDLHKAVIDFNSKYAKYKEIYDRVNGTHTATTTQAAPVSMIFGSVPDFLSLPVVEAEVAGTPPGWIKNPPIDSHFQYFVGSATDGSLTTASEKSKSNAIDQALNSFGMREPYIVPRDRQDLILNALATREVYSTHDDAKSSFTYYTLISVDKVLQPDRLTPKKYSLKGLRPIDITYDSVAGLLILDDSGRVSRVRFDAQGIQAQPLFKQPAAYTPIAISSSHESIFLGADVKEQCHISQYFLDPGRELKAESVAPALGACVGIATDGVGVYTVLPKEGEIWFRSPWGAGGHDRSWGYPTQHIFDPNVPTGGPLEFDSVGKRLLYADASGEVYAISLPDGKVSPPLAHNVGYATGIAADARHILISSGKKVLFYARNDFHWENPPDSMKGLQNGSLSGVAIDASDAAWIIDKDTSAIIGPFPLN